MATSTTLAGDPSILIPHADDAIILIPHAGDAASPDVIRESSSPAAPQPQLKRRTPSPAPRTAPTTAFDKTLASVANLANLLPTGTTLAFQSLAPSFTHGGSCLTSNRYLTAALLYICVLSCLFFSFTDSFVGGDCKLYYGVATIEGFVVLNYDGDENDPGDARRRRNAFGDLRRLRVRWVDYVHAVFTAVLFLTVAASTTGVQTCYFPDAGADAMQLLTNLPLGAGLFSALVFLVFPTTRKGVAVGQFANT